jgi:hypothetical protein
MQSRLLYATMFLLCLLIGYQTGLSISVAGASPENALLSPYPGLDVNESTAGRPAATLPNGQRNLLLITTDNLEASAPRLEGIWLLSYVANRTRLTFLPVYPGRADPPASQDQVLQDLFHLEASADQATSDAAGDDLTARSRLTLAPAFIEALGAQIPWWSSYIVLDAAALEWFREELVQQAGKDSEGALYRQGVLTNQGALFQAWCWSASHSGENPGLATVLKSHPEHILSDLDRVRLQAEILSLTAQIEKFSCEFPTLSGPGTTP